MAIQPIDLQTLFTQMDKVGKAQAAQREGLAVQQSIQNVQIQRKNEEYIQSVNAAQELGDGAEKVDEDGSGKDQGGEMGGHGEAPPPEEKPQEPPRPKKPVNWDPALGSKIDISG